MHGQVPVLLPGRKEINMTERLWELRLRLEENTHQIPGWTKAEQLENTLPQKTIWQLSAEVQEQKVPVSLHITKPASPRRLRTILRPLAAAFIHWN